MPYQNFKSIFYIIFPLMTRKFWRYGCRRPILSGLLFVYFYGICATLGATGSTDCSEVIHSTDFPRANPYFLPSFTEVLHALGVVIWIHNSCCSSGTTIQVEKHQPLEFITFIPSFSHTRICISKWKNNFSFGEKISTFYASLPLNLEFISNLNA